MAKRKTIAKEGEAARKAAARPLAIVGIGASAGGLDGLQEACGRAARR